MDEEGGVVTDGPSCINTGLMPPHQQFNVNFFGGIFFKLLSLCLSKISYRGDKNVMLTYSI